MAAREPLISDNPFRLLGLPSSTPYLVLRKEADRVARSAQAGLEHVVPLSDFLEADSLGELASSVRALAADPLRRTMYRLMWPFEETTMHALVGGHDAAPDGSTPFQSFQFLFLYGWLEFLRHGRPEDIKTANGGASLMFAYEGCVDAIAALVAFEDGIPHTDALNVAEQAKAQLLQHFYRRLAAFAADEWAQGSPAKAADLTMLLLTSTSEGEMHSVIKPIVAVGDELEKRILAETEKIKKEVPTAETRPPAQCEALQGLSNVLRPWTEEAERWGNSVWRCHDTVARQMRGRAHTLARERCGRLPALTLLKAILRLEIDEELRGRIEKDIETIGRGAPPPVDVSHGAAQTAQPAAGHGSKDPMARVPWGCLLYLAFIALGFFWALANQKSESPSYVPPSSIEDERVAPQSWKPNEAQFQKFLRDAVPPK